MAAAEAGAQVLLMEQTAHWGGRAPVDGGAIGGQSAADHIDALVEKLGTMPNVTMRIRCMGAGVYDHGYVIGYERLNDHAPDSTGPRHRLWRIRAKQVVTATGAIERPVSFAGNDVPGVMLASAGIDSADEVGDLFAAADQLTVFADGAVVSEVTPKPVLPRVACV